METKHALSNLRRLESIKARKQGRNIQAEQIKASLRNLDSKDGVALNKKIVFHSDDSDEDKICPKGENVKRGIGTVSAKLSLFPSDSEGDDNDDDINQIQIRPQFQGQNGPQFAEESCDPRFQLNSLFMEESGTEAQIVESDDETNEKQKNLEILESVLGFQLPKTNKDPSEAKKKRKYVHFNPEDESSWKYLKKPEEKEEDKTVEEDAATVNEPQVSPARYFEVSEDLKSALQGADGEFRLSKVFEFSSGKSENNDEKFSTSRTLQKDKPLLDDQHTKKPAVRNIKSSSLPSTENSGIEHHHKFFIIPGDARLTEGIEFFRREKSMEEIRENFFKTRELVLEILKRRHRRGLKSPYTARNKRR